MPNATLVNITVFGSIWHCVMREDYIALRPQKLFHKKEPQCLADLS